MQWEKIILKFLLVSHDIINYFETVQWLVVIKDFNSFYPVNNALRVTEKLSYRYLDIEVSRITFRCLALNVCLGVGDLICSTLVVYQLRLYSASSNVNAENCLTSNLKRARFKFDTVVLTFYSLEHVWSLYSAPWRGQALSS